MKKEKRIQTKEQRELKFDLFHNGLYKMKVIPNKKKTKKKFNLKKELSYYLSILIDRVFK